jgi:hypothetical protein
LWIENAPSFGTYSNEAIENFVHKYLTTDQTMLKIDIETCKSININELVCQFYYPKPPMKSIKILLDLEEGECKLHIC